MQEERCTTLGGRGGGARYIAGASYGQSIAQRSKRNESIPFATSWELTLRGEKLAPTYFTKGLKYLLLYGVQNSIRVTKDG